MEDEQAKKLYLEYRSLSEQVRKMQEFLSENEESAQGLQTTIDALEQLQKIELGNELFAPIANGIFISATLKENNTIRMNAGNGVVVKKSVNETMSILQQQQVQLRNIGKQAREEYVNALARLQAIERLVG